MLGWQIYINQEPDTSIASWRAGLGGLNWLDDLVKEGLAQDLGGNGYPCKYSASAAVIVPKILPSPPVNKEGKIVFGDDYILGGDENWDVKINQPEIDKCQPSDTLIIEAWDLS